MLNLNKCTKTKDKLESTLIFKNCSYVHVCVWGCVCVLLCTTVIHNTAQNSSDNCPSYRPDNHCSSDDVCWRDEAQLQHHTKNTTHTYSVYDDVQTSHEQVVKVIWHKSASPPHTDGSVVFARWRQCTPHIQKDGNGCHGHVPELHGIGNICILLDNHSNPPP